MPKLHHISMSHDFKIFFAVLLFIATLSGTVIGTLYVKAYLSYRALQHTAKEDLPAYYNARLTSGTKGIQDCYRVEGSNKCTSLYIEISSPHDTTTETADFIETTKQRGIKWDDYPADASSIFSEVFERQGRVYQLYILQNSNNTTRISLLLYD